MKILRTKSFWCVCCLLLICLPIILNILCLTTSPFPIIGDGDIWLNFWGSFLGGIIPVLSAIYVFEKEQQQERNRKEYEIQKEYFESLCRDMGELCSSINVNMFSFLIMNLRDIKESNKIMLEIGIIENKIMNSYNRFSLVYAHEGGSEKNLLLNTYLRHAETIRECVDKIQKSVINQIIKDKISDEYNGSINNVCKTLEDMGDISTEFYTLSEAWKKKEWENLETLRLKYING